VTSSDGRSETAHGIFNKNTVRLSYFGKFGMQVSGGSIAVSAKALTIPAMLLYLLQKNNNTATPIEICDALWNDTSLDSVNRLKAALYRFRQKYRGVFAKGDLIVTSDQGYSLNERYRIASDLDQFDRLLKAAESCRTVDERMYTLRKAVFEYKGSPFSYCFKDYWEDKISDEYEGKFCKAFNQYMLLLKSRHDYSSMLEAARHALQVVEPTDQIYGWCILALNLNLFHEQAKKLFMKAKEGLESTRFSKMEQALAQEKVTFS